MGLRAARRRHLAVLDLAAGPTCAPRSSAACRRCPVYQGELQARCARARGGGVGPGRQSAGRRGRRAGDHRADAVDAAVLLGRRGRRPLPRELLLMYPGIWRHGDWIEITTAAPRSSTGARTRRSTAAACGWAPARSTARCSRVPEVVDALVVDLPREGTDGWMPLFVVLARGRRARRRADRSDPRARARGLLAPARAQRGPPDRRGARARCRGKVLEVPVKRILTGTPPERGGQPRSRWPTPRRWTTS